MNNPGNPPDWTPFVPPYDSQYSATTHTDAQDCVEESFCHIVYMLTGKRYSPRALGYLTPVSPTGSSVEQCIEAVKAYGLIPYDLWPTPDSFTWESYYADIPASVLAQADYYDVSLIPPNLEVSPLWTELVFGVASPGVIPEQHMAAQINQTQYFDSETGNPIKPLSGATSIAYQTSMALNAIINHMQLVKDNGTTYLVATDNSFKIGIGDPATLSIFGDEKVSDGSTANIPQTGTLATGVIYHK